MAWGRLFTQWRLREREREGLKKVGGGGREKGEGAKNEIDR